MWKAVEIEKGKTKVTKIKRRREEREEKRRSRRKKKEEKTSEEKDNRSKESGRFGMRKRKHSSWRKRPRNWFLQVSIAESMSLERKQVREY